MQEEELLHGQLQLVNSDLANYIIIYMGICFKINYINLFVIRLDQRAADTAEGVRERKNGRRTVNAVDWLSS